MLVTSDVPKRRVTNWEGIKKERTNDLRAGRLTWETNIRNLVCSACQRKLIRSVDCVLTPCIEKADNVTKGSLICQTNDVTRSKKSWSYMNQARQRVALNSR